MQDIMDVRLKYFALRIRVPDTNKPMQSRAIAELRKMFNISVGWSDHSVNKNVVLRAIQA